MQRDPAAYLWDAERACGYALDFSAGRTFAALANDPFFRSAVERQLQNIGEALSQLARHFPEIAAGIPGLAKFIGFRNVLVHGYHQLNYATVWITITDDVPALRTQLQALLREVPE